MKLFFLLFVDFQLTRSQHDEKLKADKNEQVNFKLETPIWRPHVVKARSYIDSVGCNSWEIH